MAKKEKKTETKKEVTENNEEVQGNEVKKEKTKKVKVPTKTMKTTAVRQAKVRKKEKVKEQKIVKQKEPVKKQDPLTVISQFLWSVKAKHLPDILHDLMTEKEIKEFSERIEILKQLQKWATQRVIAKNLGISVTTVSRGSKVLQTGKERIKKYL